MVSLSYSSAILAPPLIDVVKPKFTCLMHREARETATLEFVTVLFRAPSKENGQLMLKRPALSNSL